MAVRSCAMYFFRNVTAGWHRICWDTGMEKRMTFEVDRTSVVEGDIVEITWDCTGADRVELKIDNGFKATVLPLETSGSKRFRLHRSKGRTALTVTAWKDGKHGSKTLKVRVKEMPTTHAETVDHKGRRVNEAKNRGEEWKRRLQALPPDKRLAVRALAILGVTLLVGMLMPRLFLLGVVALAGYLTYVLWKK